MSNGKGWHGDSFRHSLAAKGIKTTSKLSQDDLKKWAETDSDKLSGESKKNADPLQDVIETKKVKEDVGKKKGDFKTSVAKKGTKPESLKKWADTDKGKDDDFKKNLEKSDDEFMGKMSEDLKDQMSQTIQEHEGQAVDRKNLDYTEEDLREIIDNGTPRELFDAIQQHKIIDADAIEISDENMQELAQHLGDLKSDSKKAQEAAEIFGGKEDEMERYLTQKYKEYKKELSDELKETPDEDKKEEKNDLKNELEKKKFELKRQLAQHRAATAYMKDLSKYLKKIYRERKNFVDKYLR